MKISKEAVAEVRAAPEKCKRAVDSVDLTENAKATNINRAEYFVRWLHDDFELACGLRQATRIRRG